MNISWLVCNNVSDHRILNHVMVQSDDQHQVQTSGCLRFKHKMCFHKLGIKPLKMHRSRLHFVEATMFPSHLEYSGRKRHYTIITPGVCACTLANLHRTPYKLLLSLSNHICEHLYVYIIVYSSSFSLCLVVFSMFSLFPHFHFILFLLISNLVFWTAVKTLTHQHKHKHAYLFHILSQLHIQQITHATLPSLDSWEDPAKQQQLLIS